jgi:hypothetical protein
MEFKGLSANLDGLGDLGKVQIDDFYSSHDLRQPQVGVSERFSWIRVENPSHGFWQCRPPVPAAIPPFRNGLHLGQTLLLRPG